MTLRLLTETIIPAKVKRYISHIAAGFPMDPSCSARGDSLTTRIDRKIVSTYEPSKIVLTNSPVTLTKLVTQTTITLPELYWTMNATPKAAFTRTQSPSLNFLVAFRVPTTA
eukprot:1177172-Prorocentrum_minimum.AAC.1